MRNFWPFKRKPLVVTIDASVIAAIVSTAIEETLKRGEGRLSEALARQYAPQASAEPIGIDALGMPIFAATPAAESETDRRVRELFDASDSALRADRFAASRGGKAPPSMHEAPPQSTDAPQSPAVGGAGR